MTDTAPLPRGLGAALDNGPQPENSAFLLGVPIR